MSNRMLSTARRAVGSGAVVLGTAIASGVFLGLSTGSWLPSALVGAVGLLGVGSTAFTAQAAAVEPRGEGSQLTPLSMGEEISSELRLQLEELYGLAVIYERRNSPILPAVSGVLTNVLELFSRMSERTDEQSARIAGVRYADLLSKLNRALGKNYYLDIEAHPELWSHPEERMEAVETALNAMAEQLLRHIRQLNGSQDLVYQLSLDGLMESSSQEQNQRDLGLSS